MHEKQKNKKKFVFNSEILSYNIMVMPAVILLTIFSLIPMFGLVMAFQRYVPARGIMGSKWVGLDNFLYMFMLPDSIIIFRNTIIIALSKILMGIVVPVFFALLLNETRNRSFQRIIQTIVYMPHFMSWVILGGIFTSMFAIDGVFNLLVTSVFKSDPIMFMGSNTWFRPIIILTDSWKNFGYGAIIYLAALTAIDPSLYEAASIDGASRFKQLIHITLPSLVPTIILMTTLSLGSVLNAGFEQIYNMYNPLVYDTADIIDTYVYRIGLIQMQFSLGTAVGLLKSLISTSLIICSYWLAGRFAGYKLF